MEAHSGLHGLDYRKFLGYQGLKILFALGL